ncbi:hypothetical protein [Pontibacillus litoralis]|uniref:Lipase n=1 Tax=Pontibacillus litoralis JSM 072002 TaxID=1385512 RepID=A0A0A5G8U9_9BACI|nr:hypothetical protein [Pontibacillus litoralis]KGX87603.1 hypothetical protein N784_15255 [Pontibacillus litoralis JSM 072002]
MDSVSVNDTQVTDSKLVELAGFHAYRDYPDGFEFSVNHVKYEVVDTKYLHPTGLDALTVLNLSTKELTVVYVGTNTEQIEDIVTDVQLLTDLSLPQITAAKQYYEDMNKKYASAGGVSSVTGNSLGGALANAVGVNHPEVKTVTLNPALLPKGEMERLLHYSP